MVSPASDGESSRQLMQKYLDSVAAAGHFKGLFDCSEIVETCKLQTRDLSPNRTPNIFVRAWERTLEIVHEDGEELMVVPRQIQPKVPRQWLISGYAFEWPENMLPTYMLTHEASL